MVRAFRRSSAAPGQHVWDHRDHGARDLSSAVAGGSRRRGGQSDRRADPGPVLVSARRRAEPCAQGLHRRAVCGGRGIGAGLSESPRAELHALRGRSVLHDWGTSVPDRRPGPLSMRRGGRVRRSDRPPGQDSRLPHRTGRNRGPPARTAGRGRGGRAASRGAGRYATGRLCRDAGGAKRPRRVARHAAPGLEGEPAGAHGARPLAVPRAPAADGQRQAGPARLARPGRQPPAAGLYRAAQRWSSAWRRSGRMC